MELLDYYTQVARASKVEVNPYFAECLDEARDGLVCLDLRGNRDKTFNARMGDEDIVALCRALEDTDFVTSLDLSFNMISDQGADAIASLLQRCALTRLNLKSNSIGPTGAQAIAEVLSESHAAELVELDMSSNPVGDHGAMCIAAMCKFSTSLSSLKMGSTDMTHRTILMFAQALESLDTLTCLHLDNPALFSLEQESLTHLGRALRVNSTLRELSLSKFGINDQGIEELTHLMARRNSTLESLDLQSNKITMPGALHLAKWLGDPVMCLVSLNLRGNRVDNEGGAAIAHALETNTTLRSLDLTANSIGEEGLLAIASMLGKNMSLEKLHIWGNIFSDQTAQALYTALESNETCEDIDFQPYFAGSGAFVAAI